MRKKMPETEYRASRICRVLGNPTAYQIIKLLIAKRSHDIGSGMRPTDIAQELGLSLPLTSTTLRTLRNIDLARYDTKGNVKIYWIKEDALSEICTGLETLVGRLRHKQW